MTKEGRIYEGRCADCTPAAFIFVYGRLRLKYLKEHRRALYINLLTSGELAQHLNEIDQQARRMLELLVKQMAQEQGITEQMKAEDQMAWAGAMNNIRSAAEEVVMREIVSK